MYHIFFFLICSSVDVHSGCFHVLVIVNCAAWDVFLKHMGNSKGFWADAGVGCELRESLWMFPDGWNREVGSGNEDMLWRPWKKGREENG